MYYPWDEVAPKVYKFIKSNDYKPNKPLHYGLFANTFSQRDLCGDAVVWLPQDQKDFIKFCSDNNPSESDKIRWIQVRMHNSVEQNKIEF